MAKPFVWDIRTEMIKGNFETINIYTNDMVKEKSFKTIMLVYDKNVVVTATNKKLEGKPNSSFGNVSHVNSDTIAIFKENESDRIIISPVLGLNRRIGTLVFTYTANLPGGKKK